MEEVLVLSNSRASPAEATGPVTADTAVETPPGGPGAAAGVAASEGSAGPVSTTTAGAQPNGDVTASSLPECPPVSCTSAATANGTTAATTKETADFVSQRACGRPAEAAPADAGEERSAADGLSDHFPPVQPPAAALTKAAEQRRRDCPGDVAGRNSRDNLDGGTAEAGGSDNPHVPPSELAPGLSAGATRPNAPMVLVVYRSDFPPPASWRRSIEVAAVTVAGGARVTFMEIVGERDDAGVPVAGGMTGQGLEGEERYRRKVLEARLSRLLAGERTGENERMPLQPKARV